MCARCADLVSLIVLRVIPLFASPVFCVMRRIVVETFPPNGVVVEVVAYVCEDSILAAGVKCIGVGLFVCTGSNAEEAVFGVNCPESSVRADSQPCDIVADAPSLVALLLINFRRNEHCKVGLAASRRESC